MLAPHTAPELHGHLVLATPRCVFGVESHGGPQTDPLAYGLFREHLELRAGHLHLGDRPGFGLETRGVDLSEPLSDAAFAEIRDAFFAGQVLVLRGQQLMPEEFVAWARRFGPPEPHVIDQFHHPDDPNILILSNVVVDGIPSGLADAGTYFHTDYSYLAVPARATTLYSIEAPPVPSQPSNAAPITSGAQRRQPRYESSPRRIHSNATWRPSAPNTAVDAPIER